MALELDHAFIACEIEAPEADALARRGFFEGTRNEHPGQGTANRRFFFENFMLELLWVQNADEAMNEQTRRTRLLERWAERDRGASPFGVVFRPAEGKRCAAPYRTWSYRPGYLSAAEGIEFAEGTTMMEPELIYLPFIRRSEVGIQEPTGHAAQVRRIRGLSVGLPEEQNLSEASLLAQAAGLLTYFKAPEHVLVVEYTSAANAAIDCRPTLPLVFRGVT